MNKIIIDIKDDIEQAVALRFVHSVIQNGRISEADGIKHYCWVTVYTLSGGEQLIVEARRRKSGKSADSFIVYKRSNHLANPTESEEEL